MHKNIVFLCFMIFSTSAAFADSSNVTVFPPVTMENKECTAGEMRVLSWANGNKSTMCLSGQEVLKLAIPNCLEGQQVVFDGVKF